MFKYSLAERQIRAEHKRNRYRSDPVHRLATINRARVAQGLSPRASLECAKLLMPVEANS